MRLNDTVLRLIRNPETPEYMIHDAVMEMEGDVANIYVVRGLTGEYSDSRDWAVAAFLLREQAESFCEKNNQWSKENQIHFDSPSLVYDVRKNLANPDDPEMSVDYTGVQYIVEPIPLKVQS